MLFEERKKQRYVTMCPPPSRAVHRVMRQIRKMLDSLELMATERLIAIKIMQWSGSPEIMKLERLLQEIKDARHQLGHSEYHLSKEYLESATIDRADILTLHTEAGKLLRTIFYLLDWCTENDRRISYSYESHPIPRRTPSIV